MTLRRVLPAWLLLACALLGAVPHARAESLAEIFKSGNDAFYQGKLDVAAEHYQRLVDSGVHDPDVYFNLGTAHARSGDLGVAIFDFERAARLAPDDEEIDRALTLARTVLGKRRAERSGESTMQARPPLIEALVRPYRENTLAVFTVVLDLLFFALLILRRAARAETVRTGFAIAAAVTALLLGLSGSALFLKRGGLADGRSAIVLHEGAEVREGPDPRARVRGKAHEGESAKTREREGAFLRVRTADGQDGWMRSSDIGIVTAD